MELKKVLIIEDFEDTRNRVFQEFDEKGIEVLQATGPSDLEEHLAAQPDFQIVILDWLLA